MILVGRNLPIFVVTGILLLIFAIGFWQTFRVPGGTTAGPILVGITALGMIADGFFATDPYSGYPSGTPAQPLTNTLSDSTHNVVAIAAFIALATAENP